MHVLETTTTKAGAPRVAQAYAQVRTTPGVPHEGHAHVHSGFCFVKPTAGKSVPGASLRIFLGIFCERQRTKQA